MELISSIFLLQDWEDSDQFEVEYIEDEVDLEQLSQHVHNSQSRNCLEISSNDENNSLQNRPSPIAKKPRIETVINENIPHAQVIPMQNNMKRQFNQTKSRNETLLSNNTNISNTSSIPRQTVSEQNKRKEFTTTYKRNSITKTKHYEKSINQNENLLKISQEDVEIKTAYYTKKLKFYNQKLILTERSVIAQEKLNELLEELLNNISHIGN